MVLLDTTPPTAFTALPDYPGIYDMLTTATGLFPGLARLGVAQLVNGMSDARAARPGREPGTRRLIHRRAGPQPT